MYQPTKKKKKKIDTKRNDTKRNEKHETQMIDKFMFSCMLYAVPPFVFLFTLHADKTI